MSNLREKAYFGGGCFWCTEGVFSQLNGVTKITPGYAGGETGKPTYEKVSEGHTGHAEVIEVEYNPEIITYKELLDVYWASHDPTTLNQQGADMGTQYRSIIIANSMSQLEQAKESLEKLSQSKTWTKPIVTEIKTIDRHEFFPAEAYHHNYYLKNADTPYCQVVITPKIASIRAKFKKMVNAK